MKLLVKPLAPNVLRVQMLAEKKGITIETETLGIDDTSGDAFRAINPFGQIPTLILDDGTVLTESLVIARYLDEISGPPFLFGDTLAARTQIAMWERRAEFRLLNPVIEYGHHVSPLFAGRLAQFPDWAQTQVDAPRQFMEIMEARLGDLPFLAGDGFSAADITAYYGCRFAAIYAIATPGPATSAWLDRVDAVSLSRDI